ncbi:cysteine-rich receptor-like protein kinase 6 [Typha latifolia]|uniref:cysteine-rich receptor-like protein kinase 6 n=1 Tax=Typha latifolia TaxID=4733 RepID=UPI003C30A05C
MAFPLLSKPLDLLFLLLQYLFFLIILHNPITKSQNLLFYTDCPTDANYTRNSTFKANLDVLFSSLYSAASVSGFSDDTVGQLPDKVYGLAICRGDLSLEECRKCLNTSMQEIVARCPHGMSSGIWYDYCFLRYSNQSFLGFMDTDLYNYDWTGSKVTQPKLFNESLAKLMNSLTTRAAYGSPLMYAAGSVNYTDFSKIYGLLMCTRDISKDDCFRCLKFFIGEIPVCCNARGGVRVYAWNCNIRYELYPFYNITAVDNTSSPPPPPLPLPPPAAPLSPPPTKDDGGGKGGATNTIVIIVIVVVGALCLALFLFIYLWRRKREKILYSEPHLFDLDTLKAATNNFSVKNKLGEGGFGPVYKGTLQDNKEIAVKRLSRTSRQGLAELKNEVVLVTKLQHRNLARLLGFCLEEEEKLLVYEYLQHKSLDKILFDSTRRRQLDWRTRYKIIEGIGRGILYLHEDSQLKIVHRDLKTSNILLDKDMNPKISDFGLARLFDIDETHRNTSNLAGTLGYMAPEFVMSGHFSPKSDVYSFGVIVLEILTGRQNSIPQESGQLEGLLSYVWKQWAQGMAFEVTDKYIIEESPSQDVLRCIQIGLLCVQEVPSERPNMKSIVLMLSSHDSTTTLPAPKQPAFLIQSGMPNVVQCSSITVYKW